MDSLREFFGIDGLGGLLGEFLYLLMLFYAILLFLLPFFVYRASQRAKEVSQKMDKVIAILKRYESRLQLAEKAEEKSD